MGWPCSSYLIFRFLASHIEVCSDEVDVQGWSSGSWQTFQQHCGIRERGFNVLRKSTEDPKSHQIVCKCLRSCNQFDQRLIRYEPS